MAQYSILSRTMKPVTIQKNGKSPMRRRNFIFALLATCIIFSGCDDKSKGEEQDKNVSKLEKVNIGNALFRLA